MNIGIDIRSLMEEKLTGVGEYTKNLLENLFALDNKNEYYLFFNSRRDASANIPLPPSPNVHLCGFRYPNKLLNYSMKFFNWPRIDTLINKKEKTKIDLFFFPNVIFFSCSCPYIITAHDLSYDLFPEFLTVAGRIWHKIINPKKLFQNAKKIIAVSENTRNDLINVFNVSPEKILTQHSGINNAYQKLNSDDQSLSVIKQKYNLPEKFILFLGTIEPRKNVETLIDAFSIFQRKNPDYSLIIAGKTGWKCRKTLDSIKNNDKIKFISFVESEDKIYLYNLAKMFVYPSYYEGFGFPPLEAMACGCPVVMSNNSSLTEIGGEAALFIDPHNLNELAESMHNLTNPDLAQIFIQKGLKQAKKFSWPETARKYLEKFIN